MNLKKYLYFKRMNLLIKRGLKNQEIVPFDDEFYEKLSHTYISALPVSIHIKYLKPKSSPGRCLDRSLYMFFCLPDALLVRGDNMNLELLYGPEDSFHGWIELGNYVYDPTLLYRFNKHLYYQIFKPKNVFKYTKEDYCKIKENKKLYDEITNTRVDAYKKNGKKRIELITTIPLFSREEDREFIIDLNKWLKEVEYDEFESANILLKN